MPPLYEFRYEDGHIEEHISPVGTETYLNSGGEVGKRVWSTFALKSYQHDRSSWELIAPLNAEGKPMTMVEAARSGLIDRYIPGEQERTERHAREQEGRLTQHRMEQAKRLAWKQVSQQNRIEV